MVTDIITVFAENRAHTGMNVKLQNKRTIYQGVHRTKEIKDVEAPGEEQVENFITSRLEGENVF
jgi:hypothetical protein